MAVEDALVLADSFGKCGLNGTAFEHFEQRRRTKVDWTVATSWSIGRMCHLGNPLVRSLRNAALKHTPKRITEKQIRRLYSLEI
jgi:2-polyprenyl-6-methoxyphenol hydroxylase-like FAD-dependent oxidoreductase